MTKRGSSRHSTLRFQAFLRLATFLLSEFTKHPRGCKTNSPILQVGSGVPATILNLCTHPCVLQQQQLLAFILGFLVDSQGDSNQTKL